MLGNALSVGPPRCDHTSVGHSVSVQLSRLNRLIRATNLQQTDRWQMLPAKSNTYHRWANYPLYTSGDAFVGNICWWICRCVVSKCVSKNITMGLIKSTFQMSTEYSISNMYTFERISTLLCELDNSGLSSIQIKKTILLFSIVDT